MPIRPWQRRSPRRRWIRWGGSFTPDRAPMSADRRELWVVRLGRLPYDEALALQRAAARARISGAVPQDLLVLVEHPPVVTLGRSSKPQQLVCLREVLAARGLSLVAVEWVGV